MVVTVARPWAVALALVLIAAAVAQEAAAALNGTMGGVATARGDALASVASHQTRVTFAATNRGLRPVRFTAFKRIHYFQIPRNPVGTVAIFPGCSRASSAAWPYDPRRCPECLGLPEEVALTKQALARGYAVITPTTKAPNSCWSSSGYYKESDQSQVMHILSKFLLERRLFNLPLYLVGSSSGATFALKMPLYLDRFINADRRVCTSKGGKQQCRDPLENWVLPPVKNMRLLQRQLSGIVSVGSTPEPSVWGVFQSGSTNLAVRPYPPVVWVAMSNDTNGMEGAVRCRDALHRNRVPSTMSVVWARPVLPTFFSDRSAMFTPVQSELIQGALRKIGLVDQNGWLTANPKDYDKSFSRAFQWPSKLVQMLPWLTLERVPTYSLSISSSHIFQELNVAYAFHESVADLLRPALIWLEARGNANIRQLLRTARTYALARLTVDRYYPPNQRKRGQRGRL